MLEMPWLPGPTSPSISKDRIHFSPVGRPPVIKMKSTIPVSQDFHRFHLQTIHKAAPGPPIQRARLEHGDGPP